MNYGTLKNLQRIKAATLTWREEEVHPGRNGNPEPEINRRLKIVVSEASLIAKNNELLLDGLS
jgi:hypothetical protein